MVKLNELLMLLTAIVLGTIGPLALDRVGPIAGVAISEQANRHL